MATIKIVNQKLVVDNKSGLSILNNLLSQDAPVHTICGGKGICGCCRVKIVGPTHGISPLTKSKFLNFVTFEQFSSGHGVLERDCF